LPPLSKVHTVLYDGQCEICQASVAWLHTLDRRGWWIAGRSFPRASALDPKLRLEDCLRELHVLDPDGRILTGWDAVAALARLFPPTWIVGALGRIPPFRWLGRAAYRFVAANRYSLSKCRGGACKVARPETVRRRSGFPAFWSCYTLGMALKLPLALASAAKASARRVLDYARTFRRRFEFLDGKLTLCFLGSPRCDAIPIFFGERFAAVLYRGLLVDPGSPRCGGRSRGISRAFRAEPSGRRGNAPPRGARRKPELGRGEDGAPVRAGADTIESCSRPPGSLPFAAA
jgi:predicted DCC family thiol-disulfide oxidoreductase YuxK